MSRRRKHAPLDALRTGMAGWTDGVRRVAKSIEDIDTTLRFAVEVQLGQSRCLDVVLRGPMHLARELRAAVQRRKD